MIGIFRSGEGTSGGGGNRKHVLGRNGGGCRSNSGPGECHGRSRPGRLPDDEGCGALGGGGSDSGEHVDVLFGLRKMAPTECEGATFPTDDKGF